MEDKQKSKAKTFNDWLEILSKAADGVTDNTIAVEKALTLSRITESAMKVINTAVNVAGIQRPPNMLSMLIGTGGIGGLIVEEEDVPREIASPETKSKMRAELVIVERSLERDDISPVRKAFMEEKKRSLTKAIGACVFALIYAAATAIAGMNVTLAWNPSPGTNVIVNYQIYYGTATGVYSNTNSAGTNLSLTISNLVKGTSYYFSAKAVDSDGLESEFSNEASVIYVRRQVSGSVSMGQGTM